MSMLTDKDSRRLEDTTTVSDNNFEGTIHSQSL